MAKFRYIICVGIAIISICTVSAETEIPTTGTLNPNFAQHLGTITTLGATGEQGIFVINPAGELVISMPLQNIVSTSYQQLGGFLVAYDETGQALFELPQGGYQMQLTTPNGTINFSYLNQNSGVQSADILTMEADVLLQASQDGSYRFYLLITGELSVIMGPDTAGLTYKVTFTGVPALSIKQEILANTSIQVADKIYQ